MVSSYSYFLLIMIPGILCYNFIIVTEDRDNSGFNELPTIETQVQDLIFQDENAKQQICISVINSYFFKVYGWQYVEKVNNMKDYRKFHKMAPSCALFHYYVENSVIISCFSSVFSQEIHLFDRKIKRRSFACLTSTDGSVSYPYREVYVSESYVHNTFLISIRDKPTSPEPTNLRYMGIAEILGISEYSGVEQRRDELTFESRMDQTSDLMLTSMSRHRRDRLCKIAVCSLNRNINADQVKVTRNPSRFTLLLKDGKHVTIVGQTCSINGRPVDDYSIILSRRTQLQAVYFVNSKRTAQGEVIMEPTGYLIRSIPVLNPIYLRTGNAN